MEEIALRTQFSTVVPVDEVRSIINSALHREAELAGARHAYFERACRSFEQQRQMTSDEFMRRFESGDLGDDAQYFDWYAAKRGLDLWERRLRILSGIVA